MGLKTYLPLALIGFLVGTAGSDVFARMSLGGERFWYALFDHMHLAALEFVGTLMLAGPYVIIAFVCARAEIHAKTRSVAVIFAFAMIALLYYYFDGYAAAQRSMLERRWTAATLSIGLLPFFIGVPVTLIAAGATAIATRFDRRTSN